MITRGRVALTSIAFHNGDLPIWQRVRIPHRGRESFVCHSTPHTDSTSREAPTLFATIIHEKMPVVNTFLRKRQSIFQLLTIGKTSEIFLQFGEKTGKS